MLNKICLMLIASISLSSFARAECSADDLKAAVAWSIVQKRAGEGLAIEDIKIFTDKMGAIRRAVFTWSENRGGEKPAIFLGWTDYVDYADTCSEAAYSLSQVQ